MCCGLKEDCPHSAESTTQHTKCLDLEGLFDMFEYTEINIHSQEINHRIPHTHTHTDQSHTSTVRSHATEFCIFVCTYFGK